MSRNKSGEKKEMGKELKKYLRFLSMKRRIAVRAIIEETPANEDRWMALKSYFLQVDPMRVDNLFAWNLYRSSIRVRA
ncbi:hypothetical protein N9R81_06015 [Flavobacteriales bacterium]|nr:hypothetical protein [Flavobacteriales bacterium]